MAIFGMAAQSRTWDGQSRAESFHLVTGRLLHWRELPMTSMSAAVAGVSAEIE
jgi:hypothetical protein